VLRLFERLLVFPAPRRDQADWNPADLPFEDVYFQAEDGTRLHGWYVEHPNPRAVLLYCHGNGEHVANLVHRLKVLHQHIGVSVFAWDYRGYGRSEGKACEENVIADAHRAHDWLYRRAGIESGDVTLMGRSLGGAVTVAVASHRLTSGLVLDRTFADLIEAAAYNIPWLPVGRIMTNRFPAAEQIRDYHGPLLQTHGTIDEIIPIAQARRLFESAASNNKKFIEVPDLDHNSPLPDHCYQALREFLDAVSPLGRQQRKP
jgi:hypothetical protein